MPLGIFERVFAGELVEAERERAAKFKAVLRRIALGQEQDPIGVAQSALWDDGDDMLS